MANNIIKKVSVNGMEYENDNPDNYLDIYTTEERKIGTWLGEDLYRRVLTGNFNTDTYVDESPKRRYVYNITAWNIKNVKHMYGMTYGSPTDASCIPINTAFKDTSYELCAWYNSNNKEIYIRNQNYYTHKFELAIEYTKNS